MATPSQTASAIKTILKDYNYWPASESDSPLSVKTLKVPFSNDKLLALDASARKKAAKEAGTEGYKVPVNRRIATETLDQAFVPIISAAIENINAAKEGIEQGTNTLAALEVPAEALEFAVQLYDAFSKLGNPTIYKVAADGEPTISFYLAGELPGANGTETVYATTTLVNT